MKLVSFDGGIQITFALSIYFLRRLHAGHGNILCICSFLFMQVTLFYSLFLTSQDLFLEDVYLPSIPLEN